MIYFSCTISEYPKVGPLNVSALLVPRLTRGWFLLILVDMK